MQHYWWQKRTRLVSIRPDVILVTMRDDSVIVLLYLQLVSSLLDEIVAFSHSFPSRLFNRQTSSLTRNSHARTLSVIWRNWCLVTLASTDGLTAYNLVWRHLHNSKIAGGSPVVECGTLQSLRRDLLKVTRGCLGHVVLSTPGTFRCSSRIGMLK